MSRPSRLRRAGRWIDERTGVSRALGPAAKHVFPSHWSFLLGEIALYSFLVLVATGVYLSLFYVPSAAETVYDGSYEPLQGVEMSKAYDSAVRLSWDVRAGLLMRQVHHWAALVFIGSIVTHLCRNFFTGAYRRPREMNWVIGVTLFLLALLNGFAGYSLLDDLLSGTGLRVGYSIVLSVPVVGEWLAFLVFGGEFPTDQILRRLFVVHVLIVPVAIAGLLAVHLGLVWRQKHTQWPGPGRTDTNVVGTRLWPRYAAKSVGLLLMTAGVLMALGALFQINPVWLWGPYDPAAVTSAAQPDWYMLWVEGAMRLFPPWQLDLGPYVIPELFWPAVVLPGVTFGALYTWPFVEPRLLHRFGNGPPPAERPEHHVLQRPRDHPVRTAVGAAALGFYGVLLCAGGLDILAWKATLDLRGVVWGLRIALVVVPAAVGALTYVVCRDLREGTGPPAPASSNENFAVFGDDAALVGEDRLPTDEPASTSR